MTAALKVLAPGLHTTVQDLGRIGYQDIGVPVSGALDAVSLQLANALVGNSVGAPALEILVASPILEAAAERVRVAVAGPGASLAVTPPAGERRIVPGWRSVDLPRGAVFEIRLGSGAAGAYLAAAGGIAVPQVLGSASTYVRGALGGLEGRALRADDVVPLSENCAPAGPALYLPAPPSIDKDRPIRIVLGPQDDYFTEAALARLIEAEFRISPNADRMGMRLDGTVLEHRDGWDIVSDAIATGAVQVPGSGQPIVLLADHQTTGGYPKIATVISADLPILGRRRPGDAIRFAAVSVEEAEAECRTAARDLDKRLTSIAPAPAEAGIDLASLYAGNLISGVITGSE